MKKKIMIEGMMCEHCVAHVKEALEGIGASVTEIDLDGGYAICDTDKTDEAIRNVIEEEGYGVTEIE